MSKITKEELEQMSPELREKVLAALAQNTPKERSLTPKVSQKGAISVYGVGRFPVTLYLSQMAAFMEAVPNIIDFALRNAESLTVKENDDREALVNRLREFRARIQSAQEVEASETETEA